MSAANLRQEFEELLYYEAGLLDHDRLEEWLELFADNVRNV
jgi:3-phenylpropionate/cinnamic acid dioxygenase small subunit